MSVVKINTISVPEGMGPQLEERFAGRAKMVEQFDGFEKMATFVVQFKSVKKLKSDDALRECITRDSTATAKQIRDTVEKMIAKAPREKLVDWQAVSKEVRFHVHTALGCTNALL